MKLFWSNPSPFARKVMVVAHELGLGDRIACVDTQVSMSAVNRDLLPVNPLGLIPTLVLDDAVTLHDSRVICEYLDAVGGGSLFPAPPQRWDALRRQALGDGVMDVLVVWRQERLKPAERQTQDWLDTFALKIETALDQLDREAASLAGVPFDIGHVVIGCALGYLDFRFGDLNWRNGRPALTDWHAQFETRPSARATAPRKAA